MLYTRSFKPGDGKNFCMVNIFLFSDQTFTHIFVLNVILHSFESFFILIILAEQVAKISYYINSFSIMSDNILYYFWEMSTVFGLLNALVQHLTSYSET